MSTMPKIVIIAGPNVAGRKNFENHYRAAVDAWALYDNSGDEPMLLEWGERT